MLPRLNEDCIGPTQGEIYLIAHTATAARYAVPPSWRGAEVTFTSESAILYVAFGDGTIKLESAEVAVAVGEVLAPNWASGYIVPAGGTISIPVPNDATHFSVDSSAAVGSWCAYRSSGNATYGEDLDHRLGQPLLWLDAGRRRTLTITSGAATVEQWRCRVTNVPFTEASAYPDFVDAAAASSGLIRPGVGFTSGNSDKLVCSDSTLAAALGSSNAFTLAIAVRRTAAGANHTLFSVGTGGSNNGRWDVTFDSSDDFVVTRVTSAGASTTSTYAQTASAGMYTLLLTFDGSTPLFWQDGTSQTLTGTAAGDVGTTTKVAVGCRAYNTATFDQYASAEISDVLVFPTALTSEKLATLQSWLRRRHGK